LLERVKAESFWPKNGYFVLRRMRLACRALLMADRAADLRHGVIEPLCEPGL
jgi:hypothetical protein